MPLDLVGDLSNFCVPLSTFGDELCVEFPGGFNLCAQTGYDLGDPGEVVKGMLAQINTALVPLGPFFNILDVVKAVFACIQAIPDSLGPPPDPTAIIKCIPKLGEAVDKLLKLIPPFPIFVMVKGILNVIITGLMGLKVKLRALIAQVARILRAATAAAATGNVQLQVIVDCANDNMDAQLVNMNSAFAPLNRLIGIVNILLQLAGQDCIPVIGGIGEVSEAVLAPIDAIIELLQNIMAVIPGPPSLPAPLPSPGEC